MSIRGNLGEVDVSVRLLFVAAGLFSWFSGPHDSTSPAAMMGVGLHFFATGAAKVLLVRRRRAAVVLRTVDLFIMLVFNALVVANIAFDYTLTW